MKVGHDVHKIKCDGVEVRSFHVFLGGGLRKLMTVGIVVPEEINLNRADN